MKQKNSLLIAVLGLTMSALAVQTAHTQLASTAKPTSIKISALPFNITASGTYVLTGRRGI